MAHDEPAASGAPSKLAIKNVGLMLSGDLIRPILDADAIVAVNGRIAAIGRAADLDLSGATTTIDAQGVAIAPGLIDSHVHPVAGDWTPRQSQLNWIDSCLHGGVTTMVSAGEVHTPGRPRDILGLKAMAITAQRCFSSFRASGVRAPFSMSTRPNDKIVCCTGAEVRSSRFARAAPSQGEARDSIAGNAAHRDEPRGRAPFERSR